MVLRDGSENSEAEERLPAQVVEELRSIEVEKKSPEIKSFVLFSIQIPRKEKEEKKRRTTCRSENTEQKEEIMGIPASGKADCDNSLSCIGVTEEDRKALADSICGCIHSSSTLPSDCC
jgi:hypothetical protein